MSYRNIPGIVVAVVSIGLSGCSAETIIDDSCFVDSAPISSRTNTAVIGDTVTFAASLGPAECLPAGVDPPEWRWYSVQPEIVQIDSISGLATAVGPGLGAIRVEHARERSVMSNSFLEVQPAPE